MLSLTEALLYMPKEHASYPEIMNIYTDYMSVIVKYQDRNTGLWHQLIDQKDSYLETSASALFTLGLARGLNNGWLPSKYEKYALRGCEGVSSQIDDDGTVHNICRGTGVGYDHDFYLNRPTFDNDPRGLGAVLTAGSEIFKILDSLNN